MCKFINLLVIRTMLLSVLCLPIVVWANTPSQDHQATMEQLAKLRESMKELKAQLNAAKGEYQTLLDSLEASEVEISDLNKKVEQLKQELKEKQSRLHDLQQKKLALQDAKQEQAETVEQHIRAAYRLGQHSDLKMLLGQQDPTLVKRNIKYYSYIVNARQAKMDKLASTINDINRIEPAIQQQHAAIANQKKSLDNRRTALLQKSEERKKTLKTLEGLIKGKDQEYANLESERQQLENLLQRVARITEDLNLPIQQASIQSLKGKLPWPAKGVVQANYGSNRAGNKLKWQGILIQAREGDPVTAVHHGRVVFSDYLRGQGLLIILDHGDSLMSLYAHNQTLLKSVGDWVAAGDTIATIGNSGGKVSAQLYFEIRQNGLPINPNTWLKRA